MKKMFILALLVLSTQAFARQYIQCGDRDSWDGAVVNLNGENSTLFMTNGVHLPDEDQINVLKDLAFKEETQTHMVFETQGEVIDTVSVPKSVIGKYSSSFEVIFKHTKVDSGYSYERVMYCFSAIYND